MSADLDTLDIIGNDTYAANGYPHDAWTRLRREDPIHWNTRNIKNPFWAVTKHADIVWISKQPERFLNGPRLAAFPEMTPPEGDGAWCATCSTWTRPTTRCSASSRATASRRAGSSACAATSSRSRAICSTR